MHSTISLNIICGALNAHTCVHCLKPCMCVRGSRGFDYHSGAYVEQRISLAVQQGNAASGIGSFGSDASQADIFYSYNYKSMYN